MLASRANQENAVYEQQTAAASKPLNQGVKGLAPKTPANKTPFKVSLNDENATIGGGKTGGKGKQGGLFGGDKSVKVDRNAFVTPAGPRNRAPLGNKTTNAKGTAFQTPAPAAPPSTTHEKGSARPSSPRMRRARIKIHEAEAATQDGHGETERDIEFMPPREVPLPDYPDEWPLERTYPQFEADNLTKGWWAEFGKEDDEERMLLIEEEPAQGRRVGKTSAAPTPKKSTLQKVARDPLTSKAPSTLKAKNAASALSSRQSNNKPTNASTISAQNSRPVGKSQALSSLVSSKKPLHTAPGNPRHPAARAASNSTLGYSKGRAVSGTTGRKALTTETSEKQDTSAAGNEEAVAGEVKTSLDDLFIKTQGLEIGGQGEDELSAAGGDDGDALDDFQFELVEI